MVLPPRHGSYISATQRCPRSNIYIPTASIHTSCYLHYNSLLDCRRSILLGRAEMGSFNSKGDRFRHMSVKPPYCSSIKQFGLIPRCLQCTVRTLSLWYTLASCTHCWTSLPSHHCWSDSRLNMGHWHHCYFLLGVRCGIRRLNARSNTYIQRCRLYLQSYIHS